MINSSEALSIAYRAVSQTTTWGEHVGNVKLIHDRKKSEYIVSFDRYPTSKNESIERFTAVIDETNKKIKKTEQSKLESSPFEDVSNAASLPKITSLKAFENAVKALGDFREFDHIGDHKVTLVKDNYRVTFPAKPTNPPVRGPDYACEVWINSITGEVTKVLVGS